MTDKTAIQFDQVIGSCRNVFIQKMKDYGTAWRILRTTSLTDQIYIKAERIRSIDRKGLQKIKEGIGSEFTGIINYSLMALMQLELGEEKHFELDVDDAVALYDLYARKAKNLMMDKNHDYGEAWRNMRISSLTDIILMKLMRIKQIEDHRGMTFVSEGVDANYYDIINYAAFALIKLREEEDKVV
ncbi:MAG TPA: DUF1599 domain-containing protein [Bacteroidales bacterium]|nr:DUF1599 domain-containing protein [Bacteroidales bacterium]HNS47497.1 DUF1599 domain-containing protein [Bacteroidales bacterium]